MERIPLLTFLLSARNNQNFCTNWTAKKTQYGGLHDGKFKSLVHGISDRRKFILFLSQQWDRYKGKNARIENAGRIGIVCLEDRGQGESPLEAGEMIIIEISYEIYA